MSSTLFPSSEVQINSLLLQILQGANLTTWAFEGIFLGSLISFIHFIINYFVNLAPIIIKFEPNIVVSHQFPQRNPFPRMIRMIVLSRKKISFLDIAFGNVHEVPVPTSHHVNSYTIHFTGPNSSYQGIKVEPLNLHSRTY